MTTSAPIYYLVTDTGESVIDYDKCSRNDILRALLSADYTGHLLAVHCIDQRAGTWTDVSKEMAQAVIDESDTMPVGDLFDFCETQFGCHHMAELARLEGVAW